MTKPQSTQSNNALQANPANNGNNVRYVTKSQWDKMVQAGIDTEGFEVKDEMEAARVRKVDTINDRAIELLDGFLAPYEILSPVTAMKKLKNFASSSVFWHYISRQQGERKQNSLDSESGHEVPIDLRPTNLEIDQARTDISQIETHYADADAQYVHFRLACLAQERIAREFKDDPYLYEQLCQAAITEGISERGYADHCEKDAKKFADKLNKAKSASRQASTIDYMSHTRL